MILILKCMSSCCLIHRVAVILRTVKGHISDVSSLSLSLCAPYEMANANSNKLTRFPYAPVQAYPQSDQGIHKHNEV